MAGEELGLGHRFRARRKGADPGISESFIHTCRSPACFIYSFHPHSSAGANFQCWPVLSSSCSREPPVQVLTFFPSLKEPPVPVQCLQKFIDPLVQFQTRFLTFSGPPGSRFFLYKCIGGSSSQPDPVPRST